MPKPVDGGFAAMWDKEVTHIFCNFCIKEIEKGNRPTTFFNKNGWQNIAKRFKELTGRDYGKIQLKNKWDQLKKEWKIWKDLKRDSTGLGWDPIKRTIDATNEWWAEKIKAMPKVKKYRQCGIEPDFEKKMDIMFEGVVATGKHALNPSESSFSGIPDELPSEPVMSEEDVHSINQKDLDTSSSSKTPRFAKKKKDNNVMINTSIDRLIDVFAAPTPAAPPAAPLDNSIRECIIILDDMPEAVSDMKFYGNCVKKLEDHTRGQIFMTLLPERRIAYLRALAED